MDLRLDELRAALDHHEAECQDHHELLGTVDADLAALTARIAPQVEAPAAPE